MARKRKSRNRKLRGTRSGGSRKASMGDALMNSVVGGTGGFAGALTMEAADKYGGSITAGSDIISPAATMGVAALVQMFVPGSKAFATGMAGAAGFGLYGSFFPNGMLGANAPAPGDAAQVNGMARQAAY